MNEFRGFIAVEIPISKTLQNLHDEIKKSSVNVKLVELKNIHITLKFLGETKTNHIDTIEEMIQESVKEIAPFTINVQGTGVFPNTKYIKVVWVGISQSEELKKIASSLNNQLSTIGYEKDKRPFSPHLTIGRVKTAKGKEELLTILEKYKDTIFNEITINHIHLKKSTLTPKGPIYEVIKEVTLK